LIFFLDTSALVKRYVREAGSAAVRDLWRRRRRIAVSRIAHAELAAAVARGWREGALERAECDSILDRAERDFPALEVVEIRRAVVQEVRDLVLRSPLRGYDAVQLACALALDRRGIAVDLWSADVALVTAARSEGVKATRVG
jgi:predicted nucleic acid-binding protein